MRATDEYFLFVPKTFCTVIFYNFLIHDFIFILFVLCLFSRTYSHLLVNTVEYLLPSLLFILCWYSALFPYSVLLGCVYVHLFANHKLINGFIIWNISIFRMRWSYWGRNNLVFISCGSANWIDVWRVVYLSLESRYQLRLGVIYGNIFTYWRWMI